MWVTVPVYFSPSRVASVIVARCPSFSSADVRLGEQRLHLEFVEVSKGDERAGVGTVTDGTGHGHDGSVRGSDDPHSLQLLVGVGELRLRLLHAGLGLVRAERCLPTSGAPAATATATGVRRDVATGLSHALAGALRRASRGALSRSLRGALSRTLPGSLRGALSRALPGSLSRALSGA
ncbi:hypothetical protein ACFQX6_46730 [Streptosporangium lutulentum]